ncbi:E3 ubiquitin-protein ligase RNF19B [Stagonosporopsis vannaccii]|nr:E3 ubiquitin-protein ligase RNF19B [Stagonosporopsis vannaccii]
MGQYLSRQGDIRSTAPNTNPYTNADGGAKRRHRSTNPRQTDPHRRAKQCTRYSRKDTGTIPRSASRAGSPKEPSARRATTSTSRRHFTALHRRHYYNESETTSMNPRTVSQLLLREPKRQVPRQKKECVICTDNRCLSHFPSHAPTERCSHKADVCRRCLRQWITTTFAEKVWDEVNCPMCSERLDYEDVREFAPSEIFRKYERLSTNAALEAIPGFYWCLTRGCKSGHAIDPGSCKLRCMRCKMTYCVEHRTSWHKGETCRQYEYRTNKQLKKQEENASKKWLNDKAKACPGCRRPIEKADGCDHMTCTKCRHQFCWQCLVPYKKPRNPMAVTHRVNCVHYIARAVDDGLDEGMFIAYRA